MDLNQIPKPLLIVGVLLVGVALIPLLNEPHSVCQSQLKVLEENQAGYLYPKMQKKIKISPRYAPAYQLCFNSNVANTTGACAEYFDIIKGLTRDLQPLQNECGAYIQEAPPVQQALTQSLKLFVEIAWGDPPTEENAQSQLHLSWLEPSDLAIFCSVKNDWIRFFGKEAFAERRNAILASLPGELTKFETLPDGTRQCVNCTSIPRAIDKFGIEKVQARSLFQLNCDRFR